MTDELNDNGVSKTLKDEVLDPEENLQVHTIILVLILWVVLTVLGLILPTLTDADATLKYSQRLFIVAMILSTFHPGGWLNVTGLVFALKDQKYRYRWLFLSFLTALISGKVSHLLLNSWYGALGGLAGLGGV